MIFQFWNCNLLNSSSIIFFLYERITTVVEINATAGKWIKNKLEERERVRSSNSVKTNSIIWKENAESITKTVVDRNKRVERETVGEAVSTTEAIAIPTTTKQQFIDCITVSAPVSGLICYLTMFYKRLRNQMYRNPFIKPEVRWVWRVLRIVHHEPDEARCTWKFLEKTLELMLLQVGETCSFYVLKKYKKAAERIRTTKKKTPGQGVFTALLDSFHKTRKKPLIPTRQDNQHLPFTIQYVYLTRAKIFKRKIVNWLKNHFRSIVQ